MPGAGNGDRGESKAPGPSRGRQRWLAALVAALTLLTLGALLTAYYASVARRFLGMDLELSGDPLMRGDPELGFAAAPHAASVRSHPRAGQAYTVFTDSRGARVSRPGATTAAPVDVLALGCSYTWGHGVEMEQTYAERLGRRLGVTTANLAFAAYGTTQALLLLRRHADLRPRVVIYGLLLDQLRRNVMPCAPAYGPACLPAPYVDFDPGGRPFRHPPRSELHPFYERFAVSFVGADRLRPRHVLLAAQADLQRLRYGRRLSPERGPDERRAALVLLLRELRDTADALGAPLLVVHLPRLEPGTTPFPSPALQEALRLVEGPGLHFLDLAPVVAAHYAEPDAPLLRFELDGHPNPRAHQLFADAIEPVLARLLDAWPRRAPREDRPRP